MDRHCNPPACRRTAFMNDTNVNTSSTVGLRGVGVSDVGGIRLIGVWVEGSHFRLTGDRVETPEACCSYTSTGMEASTDRSARRQ